MLVPLLLALVPSAPLPVPQSPAPITSLVSSYTPGYQLCLEVTPDGKRGFLAEGATIVVLNLEVTPPTVIATHPMPDCQPLAMRYYQQGGSTGPRYLFIAGGALGVWRLTLCPSYFQHPPLPCSTGFGDLVVQQPIENGAFERKRCVDVEILETPANGPLLFALFAASSDSSQSHVGPTELRAYTFASYGAFPFASCSFDQPAISVEVGTALAVDPANNTSIYVALGKGGIRRVDLVNGTLVSPAARFWSCTGGICSGGICPEHVRDITIVRVATSPAQSVLYGALNYNEILEITDIGGTPSCTRMPLDSTTAPVRPQGFTERIAALVTGGTGVTVAVGAESGSSKYDVGRAPFNVNGIWSDICLLPGVPDSDTPSGIAFAHSQVQILQHSFASGGGSLTYKSLIDYGDPNLGWNSVVLQAGSGGSTDRMFLCSREVGTEIYDVALPTGAATAIGTPFVGETFGGQESAISLINPGVMEFAAEGSGASLPPKQMVYIDPNPGYAIAPIPLTENSPCQNPYPAPPICAGNPAMDPGLFQASLLDEAHWVDPSYTNTEYFIAGRRIVERFDQSCGLIADSAVNQDPCDSNGVPRWFVRNEIFSSFPPPQLPSVKTGWRVVSLSVPSSGMPVSGTWLAPHSWQINLPDDEDTAPSDDRVQTLADPRMTNGLPNVLYLTRSGTTHGVRAIQTSSVMSKISTSCQIPPYCGSGQILSFGPTEVKTTVTHLERELPGPLLSRCNPVSVCSAGSPAPGTHQYQNDYTTFYQTTDASGAPMCVLAIASAYPAAGDPTQQPSSCLWGQYAGQPMLVLVDVTHTGDGNFKAPQVLQVALGAGQGHAFCVRTKAAGSRVFAFVGDIMGKIWVFNVSGRNLPAATSPYLPGNTPLPPQTYIDLPIDPYDGHAANCIDLEIVGTTSTVPWGAVESESLISQVRRIPS